MVTELEERGVLGNTYDVTPERFTRLSHIPYLRFGRDGVHSIRDHHPRYRRKLCAEAQAIKADDSPDAILSIGDLGVFQNAPYYVFQDLDIGTVIHWRESNRPTYSFDQFPLQLLKQRREIQADVYRSAEGIFAVSNWIAERVRDDIDEPEKVHVVGLGHRYEILPPTGHELVDRYETPRILFVGKDGNRKGIDILIRALQEVRESIPAELTVVTKVGELTDRDRSTCKQSDHITLLEDVSLTVLNELYRTHSVFVMPSRFEAWGKVFFEAMSFGLPVIGTNRCAMPEFIIDGKNGHTCEPDIKELSASIQGIFEEYEKYERLSEGALTVAEQYTWDSVIDNIVHVMRESV